MKEDMYIFFFKYAYLTLFLCLEWLTLLYLQNGLRFFEMAPFFTEVGNMAPSFSKLE